MGRLEAGAKPDHHTPTGFRNPAGGAFAKRTISRRRWNRQLWRLVFSQTPRPPIPQGHWLTPEQALSGLAAFRDRETITWLGHAAMLLRLGGKNILLDPWLSDHASPLGSFGPRRLVPPGIPPAKLPAIDILIVSHNHYDHLDRKTIAGLAGKANIKVLVPLGMGEFFSARGFPDVRQMDWHDRVEIDGLAVTALPAVHFSRRGMRDRNRSLWMGCLIESGGRRIYFSGDTGYGPVFKHLGLRYGPVDLALVSIGAYRPETMLRSIHCTPEDAVSIGDDLRARVLVAHHWGTVILTGEPVFEPPGRFLAAGRAAGRPADDMWVMAVGETRPISARVGPGASGKAASGAS